VFDFGLGRDLGVLGSSPVLGSVLSVESACPFPSALSPTCSLSLSQINKTLEKKSMMMATDTWLQFWKYIESCAHRVGEDIPG